MATLVDTNVLLRSVQPLSVTYSNAKNAIQALLAREGRLFLAIQNVAEFWNAATRPLAYNGLGWTIEQAEMEIVRLEEFFEILTESRDSYRIWTRLVRDYRVSGAKVHDARLVAVMEAYGIERILTFNVPDFARYPGIKAIHPVLVV